ncbi:hypothetical protein Syun_030304 [Stephania yunnanensis]|uniref:Uncharacterized protein n=1 Tax=Stephania yunnanensis TaxID=152371 RepID=A0AAP0E719_9MAGN
MLLPLPLLVYTFIKHLCSRLLSLLIYVLFIGSNWQTLEASYIYNILHELEGPLSVPLIGALKLLRLPIMAFASNVLQLLEVQLLMWNLNMIKSAKNGRRSIEILRTPDRDCQGKISPFREWHYKEHGLEA